MEIKVRLVDTGQTGTVSANSEEELRRELSELQRANGQRVEVVTSMTESGLRGAVQGATFNLSDEAAGLGAGIMPGGQSYTEARDESRLKNKVAEMAHGSAYLAGELGGGFAVPGLGAAGALARSGNKLRTLAKVGAVEGALGGFGAAEGDPWDQAKSTAGGAALGSVAAPVVGGAANKIGDVAGNLVSGLRSRLTDDTGRVANTQIRRQLQGAGYDTPEAASRALVEQGDDAMLANLGAGPEMLAQRASRSSGEAKTFASDALNRQRAGAYGRLASAADEAAGTRVDYLDALDQIAQNFDVKDMYKAAYAKNYTPDESIRRQFAASESFQDAAKDVGESMLDKPIDGLQHRHINELPDEVPVEYMHRLIKALRDQTSKLYGERKSGRATDLAKITRRIDKDVKDQVPEFKAVQQRFRDRMALNEAADMGRKAIGGSEKMSPSRLKRDMASFSDADQKAFRIGVLEGMRERLLDMTPTGNTGNKLVPTERAGQLLRESIGDDRYAKLDKIKDIEQAKSGLYSRLLKNSVTGDILHDSAIDVPDIPTGDITTQAILQGFRRMVIGLVGRKMTPEEWAEVNRKLFSNMNEDELRTLYQAGWGTYAGKGVQGVSSALAGSTAAGAGAEYARPE